MLFNAEAPPFLPRWLRAIFAAQGVSLPAPSPAGRGSMGESPPLPEQYPHPTCGWCGEQWDGHIHALPACGHKYHSRCCEELLNDHAYRSRTELRAHKSSPAREASCRIPHCRAAIAHEHLAQVVASARVALDRRRLASLNADNELFVRVARLPLGGSGGVEAYRARFHALLDAEAEQIIADTHNYDMFEVNRTPGKGVLNAEGKPRLISSKDPSPGCGGSL